MKGLREVGVEWGILTKDIGSPRGLGAIMCGVHGSDY